MKPKIGDTVQFKKSGIKGTVEKILRGVCIVDTPVSKLSAWPEDLIICGLSEVSLDKEMEEHQRICDEIMAIQGIEPIEAEMEQIIHCPEDYIFKDENGNVINAQKIVLEKKEKEYPNSYSKCCDILECPFLYLMNTHRHANELQSLYMLLICRDAYWKIAGEEMGLGKPWKSDWDAKDNHFYTIYTFNGEINCSGTAHRNAVLIFPTEEMRDAFYENFKEEIEMCKELL